MVKKFVKKKIWKIPIWLIIVLLLISAVSIVTAVIVYTLEIPGQFEVLPPETGNYTIQAFKDYECTEPLTYLDLGAVRVGDNIPFSFYVKNIGNATMSVITIRIKFCASYGGTQTCGTINDLAPSQVKAHSSHLWIRPDATEGTYSFTLTLECGA